MKFKKDSQWDIELTGVDKLDRKLEVMTKKMRNRALVKAARQVGKLTQRLAKQEAPHKTGALEGSIAVRALNKRAFSRSLKIAYKELREYVGVAVVTKDGLYQGDEFYGAMLEFGTKKRKTRKGYNRGAIGKNEHAFLRPALYRFIERKRRIFITHVSRFIREQESGK